MTKIWIEFWDDSDRSFFWRKLFVNRNFTMIEIWRFDDDKKLKIFRDGKLRRVREKDKSYSSAVDKETLVFSILWGTTRFDFHTQLTWVQYFKYGKLSIVATIKSRSFKIGGFLMFVGGLLLQHVKLLWFKNLGHNSFPDKWVCTLTYAQWLDFMVFFQCTGLLRAGWRRRVSDLLYLLFR